MKKLYYVSFLLIVCYSIDLFSAEIGAGVVPEKSNKLTFITKDNIKFDVPKNLYEKYSLTVRSMLQKDPNRDAIKLPIIDSATFKELNNFLQGQVERWDMYEQRIRPLQDKTEIIRNELHTLFSLEKFSNEQIVKFFMASKILKIKSILQPFVEYLKMIETADPEKYIQIAKALLEKPQRFRPEEDERIEQ